MIPIIEYLNRHRSNLIEFPCCFIIKKYSNKILVSCHKMNDTIIVKHWYISECDREHALPKFKEFIINYNNFFNDPIIIVNDYELVTKKFEIPVPSKQLFGFDEFYPQFDNNMNHFFNGNNVKKDNLLHAFNNIYRIDDTGYSFLGISKINEETIKKTSKKYWKFWKIWKKNMLFDTRMATEIFLLNQYERMNDKQDEELSMFSMINFINYRQFF